MSIVKLPCCIIRGGTSKGIFVDEKNLPDKQEQKDKLLLALFGSPDIRQIDGLGGADPLTSKLAIITKSDTSEYDVEFLAAEVAINEANVNYGIMCGNTASGVGCFAIEQGLVEPVSPFTKIRIFCRNNNKMIYATVPVKDGLPEYEGNYSINGVPGTGAATQLDFKEPAGAITGLLLPTGNAIDVVDIGDQKIQYSLVDSGTLYAFINAIDLGVNGYEKPDELDSNYTLRNKIEDIRVAIAENLRRSLNNPEIKIFPKRIKIAIISKPHDYETLQGDMIKKEQINIVARIINPLKTHKAYAVSGAICLASAAVVEGTIVNKIYNPVSSPAEIYIGHPSGVIDVKITYDNKEALEIIGAEVKRTARILMNGMAYVKV